MGQYSSWMVGNSDCSDFFSIMINHVLYLNHVSTVIHLLSKRIIYSELKAAVCCCCASRYVPRLKIESSQPTESRGDQCCSLCRHHEQPNYPTVLFVLSAPICDTGMVASSSTTLTDTSNKRVGRPATQSSAYIPISLGQS
jgi:hypothetical protein